MPPKQPPLIRVLVAEDEAPLREAICALVRSEPGMEVVGDAETADEAIELAGELFPDVALIDVRMPGGGPHAVRGIKERSPETRLLALSAYEDLATVLEMLRAGSVAYLIKGISATEIVEAIRRAVRNQASLSIEVISDVIDELVSHKAERRESEGVLRRSEERFRALVETSPDAVIIVDGQGSIDLFNAEAERIFGYARSELIGKPVELLIPERFRATHVAQRAQYLENPHARPMGTHLDLAGLRKDGAEFPADVSLDTIQTDEGQLIVSRVRDITEAKRAAERQRTSEARFAALLESAPDGVAIIDEHGTIVQVNEQVEHLFGYAREELLGKPIETLLPDRFHEQHVAPRADYLAVAGKRNDGTEFSVDVSLTTAETDQGRMITAFIRDITERQAQAELERHLAERRALIDRLEAAGEEQRRRIADDIHDDSIQVITAAGMRLQILRRKLEDPEHIALLDELEQTIQLSIARLRHLLFELRPPALDNEGLSAALEMYIDEAGRESRANYRLDDKLMSQPDERTRLILYRIAQEAIANVGKHADAANVTVSLRDREGGYLVQIADDGIGFSPEEVKPVAGHLGLTAMRERATLAGGWLRIDAAPGEGTTVEAWIPTRAAESRQEGAAPLALPVA